MKNPLLQPFDGYIEESLNFMREIVVELKEIKELLKVHQSFHTGDGK